MKDFTKILYYRNLNELPLYNWRMYNETGERGFLLRDGMLPDTKSNSDMAWHIINDEYLLKFCDTFERHSNLKKRKKMVVNLLEFVETGNMASKMEAEILQVELFKNTESLSKLNLSFLEVVTYAEKYYGFQISETNTSTLKFFTYLKAMKNHSNGKKD